MANCSTSVLILSLVIVSSLHSSLNSNPMEAAIKSRHCVARGFVMKIKVVGCQERLVLINSCLGTCVSYSTPSGSRYEQVKSCNCCQQIKTKKVDVGLWCRDRRFPSKIVLYRYYHTVESVTQCACVSCWCSWKKQSTNCLYAETSPPFEFRNFPRWLVFVQRIRSKSASTQFHRVKFAFAVFLFVPSLDLNVAVYQHDAFRLHHIFFLELFFW